MILPMSVLRFVGRALRVAVRVLIAAGLVAVLWIWLAADLKFSR